ncbi:hypothetical protein ScPMuIL_003067 [Solemya velum]
MDAVGALNSFVWNGYGQVYSNEDWLVMTSDTEHDHFLPDPVHSESDEDHDHFLPDPVALSESDEEHDHFLPDPDLAESDPEYLHFLTAHAIPESE